MSKDKDKISTRETLQNVGFVMKYLYRVNKGLYFIRIPLLVMQTATSLVSIFFLRVILNELTGDRDLHMVILFTVGLAVTNLAVSLINRLFLLYDSRQMEKTTHGLRMMLGQAVSRMPFSDIEDPCMKDFISLAASSNSFSTLIEYVSGFIGAIVNVITYASIVLYVQPLILVLIVAVVILQTVIYKLRRKREYKWRVWRAPVFRRLEYFLNLFGDLRYGKEMRVNNLCPYFVDKSEKQFVEECRPVLKKSSTEGIGIHFSIELAKVFQKFFLYLILGVKVVFHGMLIGDFSFYLSSADKLTSCLAGVVGCFSNLMTCGVFAKEFKYCIQLSEEKSEAIMTDMVPQDADLSIVFQNVSFKYPNTENYVLQNISFTLHAGERLSLVGVNGSGKSTLVKLICRFYEPTEGEIFIGGVNTKKLSADEYTRLLGVVFQDFKLFSFSIRENIIMDTLPDEDRLAFSIQNSGLTEKVAGLEKGVETSIYKEFDETGIEFSGGEGQKVAIARAVYKDAPIIILDEPTAALDPIAEYEVYKNFNSLSQGKTAIYISHRLSSTRFTDNIAVLSNGTLIEYGSHEELMSIENGIYREMFNMQVQYYK